MAKISIIVPVFNAEKYIETCAESLLMQTMQDIEILFIDDCCTDGSINIIRKCLEKFPDRKGQVVLHKMKKNSGQAVVREWGMKNSSGEYILHCDSDDWLNINACKLLYNTALNNNSDVVVFSFARVSAKKELVVTVPMYKNSEDCMIGMMYQKTPWALWNKMFRKSIVQTIEQYPSYNMGEDMAMVFQMISKCSRISYFNDMPLYFYRENLNSITRTFSV